MLYPLKFYPILLEKPWGGNAMRPWYAHSEMPEDNDAPADALANIGESWVISAYEDHPSVVCNGFLAGNELNELIEVYMGDLVGDAVYQLYGNRFPLLLKFIDAADDLSIQVHPSDEQAQAAGQDFGKSEMWYVMPSHGQVLLGWQADESMESVQRAVSDGSLASHLRSYAVKEGDIVPIPAGTVHALKRDTVVAEIQENSDTTFRLFDYNRPGLDGKLRPLHIADAVRVLHYDAAPDAVQHPTYSSPVTQVARTPHFTTNVLQFAQPIQRDYAPLDSFVALMCVSGAVDIRTLDADASTEETEHNVILRMGEAALIPAALCDVRLIPLEPNVRLLEVYLEPDFAEE